MKKNRKVKAPTSDIVLNTVLDILIFAFVIIILVPLLWMVVSSFKETNEIFSNIWGLPAEWKFENHVTAWRTGISKYFLNSVVVTVGTIILNLTVCSLMAFSLTIFRVKFSSFFSGLAVIGMMFSPIVAIFPLYREIQQMRLYNNLLSLILIYTAYQIPMSFMLIYAFFKNIDKAYIDAARIDGASDFSILFKVFIPLSASIFMVSVVLTGFYAWNEFTFALVFIKNDVLKTIPVGLLAFQGEMYSDWGVLLAGLTISALPIIALFIFAQKYFVAGLSMGGVKG